MKMYKYLLDSVEQIDWLAIGPLLIFFIFFIGIVIYAIKMEKGYVAKMKQMPLDNNEELDFKINYENK